MANEQDKPKGTRVPVDPTEQADAIVDELVGPAAARRLRAVMPITETAKAVLGTPGVRNSVVLNLRRNR